MKKIFAIFFTVLFVFAAITLAVSAAKIDVDDKNIHYSNLLDFNPETNEYWAKQNEDGTWTHIEIDEYSQPRDAEGKLCSPILSTEYSSYAARKWSLIEGGEVLRIRKSCYRSSAGHGGSPLKRNCDTENRRRCGFP